MDSSSVPTTGAKLPLGKGTRQVVGRIKKKSNGIARDQEGGPDGGGGVPCGRGAWRTSPGGRRRRGRRTDCRRNRKGRRDDDGGVEDEERKKV